MFQIEFLIASRAHKWWCAVEEKTLSFKEITTRKKTSPWQLLSTAVNNLYVLKILLNIKKFNDDIHGVFITIIH